ncbi:helix-turn-helix domain-containing protein [Periweissella fabalis]|uniref:Helix-turn-helix transcriptional regulator n=1 Tax=Periweissella fabalis TaxID=1070421 RepID=A0A7X6S2S7_9LACO|nr:helix-turn-helix transcriptional regulator [Periweissella fabalis]MCM0599142.1 helix-turn-helix transcriptional regulator [Periweissella fabalis]NKZ23421.1 helix-turn-helix transcriptional regulator [Periweissella fabalis]
MTKIDDYIAKRSQDNPEFAQMLEQADLNLEIGIQVRNLREELKMSQRDFAALIGKPQSTIARIESGTTNANTTTLAEIARATHQKITIQFTPI